MKHFSVDWVRRTTKKKFLSLQFPLGFLFLFEEKESNKSILMPFRSAYEVCSKFVVMEKHFLIRPSSSFAKHVFNYPLVKMRTNDESCWNRILCVGTFSQFFFCQPLQNWWAKKNLSECNIPIWRTRFAFPFVVDWRI